ncbi:MAG: alkaline phosphatase family protein [Elusimicrobiota bacterium]
MRLPPRLGPGLFLYQAALIAVLGLAMYMAIRPPPSRLPAGPSARVRAPRLARRVVVVLFDALRSDAAYDPALMPAFNRLAEEGVCGRCEASAVTTTGPSLQTMFTGRPVRLLDFAHNFAFPVHPRANLVPIARRAGRKLYLMGPVIGESFRRYNEARGRRWPVRSYPGASEADRALLAETLDVLDGRDFDLLMVHFDAADHAAHLFGPFSEAYRREVRFYDEALARIAGRIDPRDTVLLALSDHGVDDEGYHTAPDPAITRPPFVLWGRGIRRGGRARLAQRDLCPTLAALLGVQTPPGSLGRFVAEAFDTDPGALGLLASANARQRERAFRPLRAGRVREQALTALLAALACLAALPALWAAIRRRPWVLLLFAGAAALPWVDAALNVMDRFAALARGWRLDATAADVAALALFLPMAWMGLRSGERYPRGVWAWAWLGMVLSAFACRLAAEPGAHGLFLCCVGACLAAGVLADRQGRPPTLPERTTALACLLMSFCLYYGFRGEVLVAVLFCALLMLLPRGMGAGPGRDPALLVLGYFVLRFFVYLAFGNDLSFRLGDVRNDFLLSGTGTLALPWVVLAVGLRVFLPDLLLVGTVCAALRERAPRPWAGPGRAVGPHAGRARMGHFCFGVTAGYVVLVASALLRAQLERAGPVLHWAEIQAASTFYGALLFFFASCLLCHASLGSAMSRARRHSRA